MERPRTSPIWKISSNEFRELVKKSETLSEIFKAFGMSNKGANYKTLVRRLEEENIPVEHLRKGPKIPPKAQPISQILVENSSFNRTHLKERLIKENIVEYVCQKCRTGPNWNGLKLSLQLDHKNGVSNDNRVENLQFLCPNCHSQTTSYAGKNKKYQLQ